MSSELPFLSGGGRMGARMRAHDWAATPLGPPDTWPQSLRAAVSICLNSPVLGTVLWGPEMIMLYNDAYISALAERHPHALGRSMAEVWGNTWDTIAAPFEQTMKTGEGFAQDRIRLPIVRRGQLETTYWNITASPIRSEDGSIAGLFNQGFEITSQIIAEHERTAAEEELRLFNERLAGEVARRTEERDLMWDTSLDLMQIVDSDGILRRVNPACTRVLGYSQEDMVDHHVNTFVVPEDRSDTACAYEQAARGEQPLLINRCLHKDGSVVWVSWAAAHAGNLTYASGRDITLEKEREAELERAQAQLRQAQKMEAVGQLTGGLAHDFNNLLMAISASLDLIRLRIGQSRQEETERFIDAAQDATKRAAALTHRLLAFSRRQPLAPRPIDANQLIEGMLDLIRGTVGPGISVECSGDQQPWIALVDPSQLENALLNLCINARDAMPNGGSIVIEIDSQKMGSEIARQLDLPKGDYLRLSVSDTGSGMSPEVVARAFDPFFTTKPLGVGTGLGLSMIYGFAKQSGGQVRLVSTAGVGTEVSIFLPRHLGPARTLTKAQTGHALPGADAGETVLVVDDEPTVRMLVTEVLQDLGYRTIEAGTGPAALELLRSDTRIDLLITDVGLPGSMNGRQLADAGRMTRADLPVLFITGYAEQALFDISHAGSGMAVLTKPFAVARLASRIRKLLQA